MGFVGWLLLFVLLVWCFVLPFGYLSKDFVFAFLVILFYFWALLKGTDYSLVGRKWVGGPCLQNFEDYIIFLSQAL